MKKIKEDSIWHNMRVLIACEESQAICIEFRKLWIEAYSCDIQPCSWWHPERHIQWDAIEEAYSWKYDLMIAHPPCTYLSTAWIRWFNIEKYWAKAIERYKNRDEALEFLLKLYNAPIKHIAIENPRWFVSSMWRKPDQTIQPRQFWDEFNKPTCLRLKNLPLLLKTKIVWKWEMVTHITKKWKTKTDSKRYYEAFKLPPKERAKLRSKTFPWIAKAIAQQRSEHIIKSEKSLFL